MILRWVPRAHGSSARLSRQPRSSMRFGPRSGAPSKQRGTLRIASRTASRITSERFAYPPPRTISSISSTNFGANFAGMGSTRIVSPRWNMRGGHTRLVADRPGSRRFWMFAAVSGQPTLPGRGPSTVTGCRARRRFGCSPGSLPDQRQRLTAAHPFEGRDSNIAAISSSLRPRPHRTESVLDPWVELFVPVDARGSTSPGTAPSHPRGRISHRPGGASIICESKYIYLHALIIEHEDPFDLDA